MAPFPTASAAASVPLGDSAPSANDDPGTFIIVITALAIAFGIAFLGCLARCFKSRSRPRDPEGNEASDHLCHRYPRVSYHGKPNQSEPNACNDMPEPFLQRHRRSARANHRSEVFVAEPLPTVFGRAHPSRMNRHGRGRGASTSPVMGARNYTHGLIRPTTLFGDTKANSTNSFETIPPPVYRP